MVTRMVQKDMGLDVKSNDYKCKMVGYNNFKVGMVETGLGQHYIRQDKPGHVSPNNFNLSATERAAQGSLRASVAINIKEIAALKGRLQDVGNQPGQEIKELGEDHQNLLGKVPSMDVGLSEGPDKFGEQQSNHNEGVSSTHPRLGDLDNKSGNAFFQVVEVHEAIN